MPLADHAAYCRMLDTALRGGFAYPAINVLETNTLNAAVEGLAAAGSDGIVQISVAAGTHTSGAARDAVLGAITLAEHAARLAEKYGVLVAIHTDHCPPEKVDTFLRPLIAETARRRAEGRPNLFQSHMFDGSALPLRANLDQAEDLLALCAGNDIILEVETGVVGGEEEGRTGTGAAMYTIPGDMVEVYARLSQVAAGKFMLAATFGNVHGYYKPGNVVLKPTILREGQEAVVARFGDQARLWLVFHGGSGTTIEEFRESIRYGVVKINIHTDTQYAFTRGVADFMFKRYDEILRVDGEVGVKNSYLASTWLDAGRAGMTERVVRACHELGSAGKSLLQT